MLSLNNLKFEFILLFFIFGCAYIPSSESEFSFGINPNEIKILKDSDKGCYKILKVIPTESIFHDLSFEKSIFFEINRLKSAAKNRGANAIGNIIIKRKKNYVLGQADGFFCENIDKENSEKKITSYNEDQYKTTELKDE